MATTLFPLALMPVFEYIALNEKGRRVAGIVDAESAPAARLKLRSSQVFPVQIREAHTAAAKKGRERFRDYFHFARVKAWEVTTMTRQLATLVGAGFQLDAALNALIPQTPSHALQRLLAQLKEAIVAGASFSQALAQHPHIFSPLFVNMIHAGENSGTLDIVLERLAEIHEKQQALRNRIQMAMTYPILMAVIGMLVLFFLLTFIVPSITGIFADMNQTLPTPTRLLIMVSGFFKSWWWALAVPVCLLPIGLGRFKRRPKGRYALDRFKLWLPLSRAIVQKLAVARFSRTLSSLLENGVSMLVALDIVKNVTGNLLIARAVESAAAAVGQGKGLAAALSASGLFPPLSIQMIQLGEQSGELEKMLAKIAEAFEVEVESAVMRATALLEPLMIVVMGSVVGFIVLSICLPIFEMNQLVK
jgi:general secretion pathway protein F